MNEQILCCMRVADWDPKLQSVVDQCATCRAAVWVALSTPRRDYTRILCMQCGAHELATIPDAEIAPPTMRQIADLKRSRG